jgi:WD40 repeat protein
LKLKIPHVSNPRSIEFLAELFCILNFLSVHSWKYAYAYQHCRCKVRTAGDTSIKDTQIEMFEQVDWVDEPTRYTHHSRQACAVAVCGDYLFSCSVNDSIVRICRTVSTSSSINTTDSGAIRMEGHTGAVFALCVVGNLVISGSLDRRLGVWDSRTGRLLRFLQGHSNTVCCLHAVESTVEGDADNKTSANVLVSGSLDRTVVVWNMADRQDVSRWSQSGVFAGHRDCVNCVGSWSGRILSGSSDGTIALWRPHLVCEQTPAGPAASDAVLDNGREVSLAWRVKHA